MIMLPRIKGVRHAGEYRLALSFTDGTTSEVDLRGRIAGRGGFVVPLQDIEFFRQVRVDAEVGTIVWPNGVDFCPDVLYRTSGQKSTPLGQTIVPTSASTRTCLKNSMSCSGTTNPPRPAIRPLRSTSLVVPSVKLNARRYSPACRTPFMRGSIIIS